MPRRKKLFPVSIETPRLILREMVPSDWVAMQRFASDPEVVRYETWGPNSEEDTREFIRYVIACQEGEADKPRRTFELAVTLRSTGEVIGSAGIRVRDPENREGDLGYTLRRDQWGKGLATEIALALVDFGLDRLQMHRIWATCHSENLASARVLEKAGMKREGLLRKNKLQRGEWRDSCLFAILESDPRVSNAP